jgi:hypothetical protein
MERPSTQHDRNQMTPIRGTNRACRSALCSLDLFLSAITRCIDQREWENRNLGRDVRADAVIQSMTVKSPFAKRQRASLTRLLDYSNSKQTN